MMEWIPVGLSRLIILGKPMQGMLKPLPFMTLLSTSTAPLSKGG